MAMAAFVALEKSTLARLLQTSEKLDVLVYIAVVSECDNSTRTTTTRRLAAVANVHLSRVSAALQRLIAGGYIRIAYRTEKGTSYEILRSQAPIAPGDRDPRSRQAIAIAPGDRGTIAPGDRGRSHQAIAPPHRQEPSKIEFPSSPPPGSEAPARVPSPAAMGSGGGGSDFVSHYSDYAIPKEHWLELGRLTDVLTDWPGAAGKGVALRYWRRLLPAIGRHGATADEQLRYLRWARHEVSILEAKSPLAVACTDARFEPWLERDRRARADADRRLAIPNAIRRPMRIDAPADASPHAVAEGAANLLRAIHAEGDRGSTSTGNRQNRPVPASPESGCQGDSTPAIARAV